jgi:hypothetical protein
MTRRERLDASGIVLRVTGWGIDGIKIFRKEADQEYTRWGQRKITWRGGNGSGLDKNAGLRAYCHHKNERRIGDG